MICYLNIMYHFEEGLMADERKLNEQPSINKDYYYYYYYYNTIYGLDTFEHVWRSENTCVAVLKLLSSGIKPPTLTLWCLSATNISSQRVNSLARVVITPVRHTQAYNHNIAVQTENYNRICLCLNLAVSRSIATIVATTISLPIGIMDRMSLHDLLLQWKQYDCTWFR